ncbi:hypothetical protein KFK09_021728 [Dendrobium nobile]|uniref:Amine oxidase domain-containing protein n=1 Tax=Dendrobium nobile TaxID=94219 RepID=A0A8T3AGK0_DENNO|nr:hypothetical protein KFK09_021728 [Dendrobium nobile]
MAHLILPQIPASSLHTSTPARRTPLPTCSSANPQSPASPSSILIIGGGLAGLAAATHLHAAKLPFLLLESSDGLGGRVRTDSVDGFLLDRGFQILLTAYPEARRLLHFPSLDLRPFYPGALVFHSGRLHRVADPFRRPIDSLLSLPNPIGSVLDKLIVGIHRLRAPTSYPETTISHRLRALGLSPSIIDRFFPPLPSRNILRSRPLHFLPPLRFHLSMPCRRRQRPSRPWHRSHPHPARCQSALILHPPPIQSSLHRSRKPTGRKSRRRRDPRGKPGSDRRRRAAGGAAPSSPN